MPGIDYSNLITIVALIAASFLISHLVGQHLLRQARENSREQLELRLAGLTHAITELEARVAELTRTTESRFSALARAPRTLAIAAPPGTAKVIQPPAPETEVPTEVLILISAAVTSFLGKQVRIRSAKMLQSPYEIVNPWAQQGRVIVQASHNLQVRHG